MSAGATSTKQLLGLRPKARSARLEGGHGRRPAAVRRARAQAATVLRDRCVRTERKDVFLRGGRHGSRVVDVGEVVAKGARVDERHARVHTRRAARAVGGRTVEEGRGRQREAGATAIATHEAEPTPAAVSGQNAHVIAREENTSAEGAAGTRSHEQRLPGVLLLARFLQKRQNCVNVGAE